MIHFISEGGFVHTGINFRSGKHSAFQMIIRIPMPWTVKRDRWEDLYNDCIFYDVRLRKNIAIRFRLRSLSLLKSWNHFSFFGKLKRAWIVAFSQWYNISSYGKRINREFDEDNI